MNRPDSELNEKEKLNELQKKIRYSFRNTDLLINALTHSSYINEHSREYQDCNERLEFLGDAILERISSEFIFSHFPEEPEGVLTKIRSSLVCEKSLSEAAKKLSLGEYLYLGKGMEKTGGRISPSILSDAFEALLAAIVLDGGESEAKRLVEEEVLTLSQEERFHDGKTKLQEMAQDRGKAVTYRLTEESGPVHDRVFTYEAILEDRILATGTGHSKKEAQNLAALEALNKIGNGEICI